MRRFYTWLSEKLWVQPVMFSIGAIAVVWLCTLFDYIPKTEFLPDISSSIVETMMQTLTASMLGVATFAVASMVSAYGSVGTNATPRAFSLIISDDISKRALSSFIAAFIYGTIGMIAINLKFYDLPGRFALFCATLAVYAWVIWIFMRWVDSIARLGRMGTAIARVETATLKSLKGEALEPLQDCADQPEEFDISRPVFTSEIGYIQDIDYSDLQECAEEFGGKVHIAATPGSFVGPGRPVAYLEGADATFNDNKVAKAFYTGKQRWFSSDPRFGFVVLAQIASRALSPGVNDPGTAIDVMGSATRLLLLWTRERRREESRRMEEGHEPSFPNVTYPRLAVAELLLDAFTAISRDGAGQIEVMLRLQKDLELLAAADNGALREAAAEFSRTALERSKLSVEYEGDQKLILEVANSVQKIARRNEDSVHHDVSSAKSIS